MPFRSRSLSDTADKVAQRGATQRYSYNQRSFYASRIRLRLRRAEIKAFVPCSALRRAPLPGATWSPTTEMILDE